MGRPGLGNLCKGPSAALHPSSQVTEFTSLIIGGNRKVIGIECCHRINVSQLHRNVWALLYCLCSRNTVASQRYLSGIGKRSALTGRAPQPLPGRPRGIAHTPVPTQGLGGGRGPGSWVPFGGQWGKPDRLRFRDPTVLPHEVSLSCRDPQPPPPWPRTACCRGEAETVAQPRPGAVVAPEDRRPQGGQVRPREPEANERNISGRFTILEMKSTAFFGWRLSVP